MNLILVIFCYLVSANLAQDQGKSANCPANEILDSCANALCRRLNCSQLGYDVACPSVLNCVPACVCQTGYLRTHNNTCVPEAQCELEH